MSEAPVAPDLGADLDLRLVRYFTVVAEHLNFGRAAAALHVAQPALSRQIQRLERDLGVRLFDRTPQGSRLTEAGRAFLPKARALLHDARRAALIARAAGTPAAVAIGFADDLVITPAVRELRRRHPEARVETRHLGWAEGRDALLEHRVDALVTRMPFPFDSQGLCVTVLYDEPRVLVIPSSHRLAGREWVVTDDFAEDDIVPCPITAPTEWNEFWRLTPTAGQSTSVGVAPSFEDRLELVAGGLAIAVLPAGDRRFTLRDDIAAVPIRGIDPYQVVVVTREQDSDLLVADFLATARAKLTGA
ncbi:LysR family transcriptional regulator [Mycolicibacterium litorale]|uniref:Probable hydrogen peroxide-inducible genes activator n=1 Tax=Mycolicibacterium litorale TaxID=758802 RepID=A0AAD1MRT4_9MYCO|nr:LysR family transcriptional regulator [Mycolicibacterium litorale]BBY14518.1 LysR family transcriptional regulator [Mycolicibacterium litorale]